jgi:hypothetical protein
MHASADDLFSVDRDRVVTMVRSHAEAAAVIAGQSKDLDAFVARGGTKAAFGGLSILGDAEPADANGAGDQFMVFQLNNTLDGPTIVDATQVDPSLAGDAENPDVLCAIEMLSFHLGASEPAEPNTRVTLRMDIGKDESSTDKRFDMVFWSVAAGLNLYDTVTKKRPESRDLKSDFSKAFSNRPVEIPGGLSRVIFNVVKHNEPPWWKRIFRFAESDTARTLVSTFGLPAATLQVIGIFDRLLSNLTDSSPEVLFKGLPMRLAFTKQARTDFTGGNPRVTMGAINRGFCVFARSRDFDRVAESNALYHPTIGKLIPAGVSPADAVAGRFDDPLRDTTYAVFRVGTKATKLDPTFNYSG